MIYETTILNHGKVQLWSRMSIKSDKHHVFNASGTDHEENNEPQSNLTTLTDICVNNFYCRIIGSTLADFMLKKSGQNQGQPHKTHA